jgi:hypothetical protein
MRLLASKLRQLPVQASSALRMKAKKSRTIRIELVNICRVHEQDLSAARVSAAS